MALPSEVRELRITSSKDLLAFNVRRLRGRAGWSQEMLAKFAGLHPTEVSRIERGLREARLSTVLGLAQALKCSVDDLVAVPEVPMSEHNYVGGR